MSATLRDQPTNQPTPHRKSMWTQRLTFLLRPLHPAVTPADLLEVQQDDTAHSKEQGFRSKKYPVGTVAQIPFSFLFLFFRGSRLYRGREDKGSSKYSAFMRSSIYVFCWGGGGGGLFVCFVLFCLFVFCGGFFCFFLCLTYDIFGLKLGTSSYVHIFVLGSNIYNACVLHLCSCIC